MIALLLESQGRRSEAKEAYRRTLAIDPHSALASNNLAWLMAEDNENLDGALRLALTARGASPTSPDVSDTLGWIYYKKGMFGNAVEMLKDAVDRRPDAVGFRYHFGLALAKNGDTKLARQTLEAALKLDPKAAEAAEAKGVLAELAALGS
jgi:Flp pilus assembly protein TadD